MNYESLFHGKGIEEPEIIVIKKVDIYNDPENKTANTIADAGLKFKQLVKKQPSFLTRTKNLLNKELKSLTGSKLVTNPPSPIKRFFKTSKSEYIVPPPSPFHIVHENQNFEPDPSTFTEPGGEPVEPGGEPVEPGGEPDEADGLDQVIINEVLDSVIEATVGTSGDIQSDLEFLKSSKLVSSKK